MAINDPPEDHLDTEPPQKKQKTTRANEQQRAPREIGLMRSTPGEKLASFVGSSSGIYFIRSVYSAARSQANAPGVSNNTPGSDLVPGEDDQLPSTTSTSNTKYLWQDTEVMLSSQRSSKYSYDDIMNWSQSYFDIWHQTYPFLHAPSVLDFFDKLADGKVNFEGPPSFELVIVRSIMSISLADRRQASGESTTPVPAELTFESYEAATGSIAKVLIEPTSILSLQATISVQLFLVSMLRYNGASRLEGLVVRMAVQLGLHRCPVRYSAFSHEECQLRKRIFWSLYAIDRYICHALGLPLGLQDDDLDVCLPSKERHSKKQHDTADDRLYLLEILAKHAEIRGMIIELRNKSIAYNQKNQDQAVIITAKSMKWWNEVEEFLEASDGDSEALAETHRTMLMVLKHENVIALNRPILAVSKKSSGYGAALQDCIGAARSITNILWKALHTRQVNGALPLLWHSYTWAIWMSAYIIFYATNEGEVRSDIALRLTNRCLEILGHLALRGNVWPDACAAAIRDLRTQMEQRESNDDTPQSATSVGNNTAPRPESEGQRARQSSTTQRSMTQHSITTAATDPRTGWAISSPNAQSQTHQVASQPNGSLGISPTNGTAMKTSNGQQVMPTQDYQAGYGHGHLGMPGQGATPLQSQQGQSQSWNVTEPGYDPYGMPLVPGISPEPSDPFYGFDIPFWMGQDQYSLLSNEWV